MAESIRSPACNHCTRDPHWAIVRHRTPAAIIIQILISNDIVGNIACRRGTVHSLVAVSAPTVKHIEVASVAYIRSELIGPREGDTFIGMNRKSLPCSGNLAFAVTDRDNGCVTLIIDLQPVIAGPKKVEG